MAAGNRLDLVGQKINMLLVLEAVKKPDNRKQVFWKCRCDCGNITVIPTGCLRRKRTTFSCGCKRKDISKKLWQGYEEISMSYWSRLKRGAKVRGLPFDITMEQVWDLYLKQDKKCGLSGVPITFSKVIKKTETQTASMDRIDGTRGYTIDNVMWVHKKINEMKM